MARQSIFDMKVSKSIRCCFRKWSGKASKEGLDTAIKWLTGYAWMGDQEMTYGDFFKQAPAMNPRAELIKGKVCGVQVETIEDPMMQKVRWLDKLVDELAKGRPLEKVLR